MLRGYGPMGYVMPLPLERTGVVLSAGGVSGAYQVGMLDGIIDVLGLRDAAGPPLFDVFSGTSIGALNAAYLAANADRPDHAIGELVKIWERLELGDTLRCSPLALWGWPRWPMPKRHDPDPAHGSRYVGRSLFNPKPIAQLIERVIAWDRLRANIDDALVQALVVAAFDFCDGRTTLFADLAPGVELLPSKYPELRTRLRPVTPDTVQASSAMPFVFPAMNIDGRYYMDGALHFSTPIVAAVSARAQRLLVISLLHEPEHNPTGALNFPGLVHLLGKVASVLLLDPVITDLQGLLRTNRIYDVMRESLESKQFAEIIASLEDEAVVPLHSVPTLVFRPSQDIAAITSKFIQEDLGETSIHAVNRALIRMLGRAGGGHPAVLASIMLLDGRLATRLIALGRQDAHAASDRIVAFFAGD